MLMNKKEIHFLVYVGFVLIDDDLLVAYVSEVTIDRFPLD